ncbi:glycerophosphodiester phosphodiesterase [Paenibacillus sp.]|uniref:glycerophosphodiester phosphodiesterase n=1 Tax=Paenibacillus sp. TaxID=58172 RepID=UPI00281243A6|nr:glycerophosphodiester phosphodiesterase [Paenibacillus sp.]
MNRTWIGAHTGCGDAPDNTWASYLEGVASGADIVEVDVLTARDGTLLLLHDDKPELKSHGFAELNEPGLRARVAPRHGEHELARLDDVLRHAAMHRIRLNLDLKSLEAIDPALALVRMYGAEELAFVTGCSAGMPERHPDVPALWNAPTAAPPAGEEQAYAEAVCETAVRLGYRGINLNKATCSETVVRSAQAAGLSVWVYTVNEPEEMRRFAAMGVDAITTRRPKTLRECLTAARTISKEDDDLRR